MSNLFWLTQAQMARLRPYFPKNHGPPRVDDLRVLSDIIFVNRNGLRWCDAPKEYGPARTIYNRWKRWSDNGVFARVLVGLAAEGTKDNRDRCHLSEGAPHGLQPAREKEGRGRQIGRTKGGMNTCPSSNDLEQAA